MKTIFKVTISLFVIFEFSTISFAQDVSLGGGEVAEPFGQVNFPKGDTLSITITQSVDPDSVLDYGSIACRNPNNNYTSENHYWRSFVLNDFGIIYDFNVTLVDIGIQQALAGSGGVQPLTCNLYIMEDETPFPIGYPNSLILIGTTTLDVPDQAVSHFPISIPDSVTAPAGSELVVEIAIPHGWAEGNIFFIGINHFGENAQSYFTSKNCNFPIPVPPPALPNQHYVMSVTGYVIPPSEQLFEEKVDYYVGKRPNTIVSADFDNDGDIDLAASPNTDNGDGLGLVSILKNNGDGTFFLAESLLVGDAPNLLAVDLENDTNVDLVVSDWWTPYQMYRIMNDGFGNFTLTDNFPSYGSQAHLLCAADFDSDSNIDLAVPNSGSSNLGIFFNNGDGTFAIPPPLITVGSTPICAVSRDLDADGDPDLVVSLASQGGIRVLLNDGTGNFPTGTNYQTGSFAFAHSLADYNGDGCLDVAVPNVFDNTLSVLFGNCDGTFSSKVDYPGCHPIFAASADFDNDGDIDIAVSNNGCNTVTIYINKGDTTFTPDYSLATGNGPVGIVANDFDNDGDIDLAVCNFDNLESHNTPGYTVSVFINRTVIINEVESGSDPVPNSFVLEQNYPNPFNPSTKIKYSVPQTSQVQIKVYDVLGNEIETLVNEEKPAGTYEVEFNSHSGNVRNLTSGVYFYKIQAGSYIATKKMILLK